MLVALVAFPGVPLDDEVLAAVAAGATVGLGLALAWVRRDWSRGVKATGAAAALAGALVGA